MKRNTTSELFKKLNNFITKYYQNQLIKGSIYVGSMLLIFFILFSLIEHFSALSVVGRTFLFWAYILLNLTVFVKYIAIPLLHLLKIGNRINNKDAAKIIGNHFKDVDDKLLNILELEDLSESNNTLISASIEQKIKTLKPIHFSNAIDFYSNKKQLKWLLIPLAIFILFFISGKEYILTESSARIVKHNTFFEPEAPFNYQILNDNLNCIQFEDYNLKLKVVGNEIPNEIFVKIRDNTYKAKSTGNNVFEYLFKSINTDVEFNLLAGGYNSQIFTIKSLSQPKVVDMGITIHPPKYTNATIKKVENNGDIIIAEGSNIKWRIQLQNTTNCSIVFDNKVEKKSTTHHYLSFQKKIYSNTTYSIISSNENNLTDSLTYYIKVIPDELPQILLEQEYDSSNQQHIFNGTIEDDYKLR